MGINRTLILFSGGIESTALLTTATTNSIAVVITNNTINLKPNIFNATKICEYFSIPMYSIALDIPIIPDKWTHQIHVFISMSNILINMLNNINRVIFGQNSSEPLEINKPIFSKVLGDWNYIHSNIEFEAPLRNLSKYQQWELIPKAIRPLTISCTKGTNCRVCHKCLETPWRWGY